MFTIDNPNDEIISHFRQFNFAFDPNWDEKAVFQKFKNVIKSDPIYYKYKMYLTDLTSCRSFKTFITKKHAIQHTIDNLPIFWFLGEQIYSIYREKHQKTNEAIYYRCVWSVNINKYTEVETISNISFYHYEYDKTILEVY